MEQNNRSPKQYTGTKGLSLAIVVGVALGTLIGKLMDNMQTGMMIGLVLGVCGWVLLFNRRPKRSDGQGSEEERTPDNAEETEQKK